MNNNTEAQQAKQRAQQFEQQAQLAKPGEQKAQAVTAEKAQLSDSTMSAVAGAEMGLDSVKYEVAKEVGIPNYDQIDRGNLTARQNGTIGGQMTKGLLQMSESDMMNNK